MQEREILVVTVLRDRYVFVREMTIRSSWADTSTRNSRTGAAVDGKLSLRDTCAGLARVYTRAYVSLSTNRRPAIGVNNFSPTEDIGTTSTVLCAPGVKSITNVDLMGRRYGLSRQEPR